jgi:hypothetical protein
VVLQRKTDPLAGIGLALRPSRSKTTNDARQPADLRAVALAADDARARQLRERAREVLIDAGIDCDDARAERVVAELASIGRDLSSIQARMISTGHALLRLQAEVGKGGYKALVLAGLVPIPEATASRLRKIATAVDGGIIPAELLPRAVQAAAMVATLPEHEAQRLIGMGVIRLEATTREIREALHPPVLSKPSHGPLAPAERRRLERRLHAIDSARKALDAEEAEIRQRLSQAEAI